MSVELDVLVLLLDELVVASVIAASPEVVFAHWRLRKVVVGRRSG